MECTTASVPPQGGRKHPQQEFLQVDTTNILFIAGGAFAGLEKIIGDRLQGTSIGFGAHVSGPDERRAGEATGRAPCRERACQDGQIWVVAVSLKTNTKNYQRVQTT